MSLFKSDESVGIEVQGKQLQCLVCGNQTFRKRQAQLNTSGAEFLNLGWANQAANCLVCEKCGYIHWFVPT